MSPTRQTSPSMLFMQSKSGSYSVNIELVILFRRVGVGGINIIDVVCCSVKLTMPRLFQTMCK